MEEEYVDASEMNQIFIKPFIIARTQRAFLVRVPHSKWKVWIPKSMCYQDINACFYDSFIFYVTDGEHKSRCTAKAVTDKFAGISEWYPTVHKPKEVSSLRINRFYIIR